MPSLKGVPEWQSLMISGDSMMRNKLEYIEILKNPGPLFETIPAQSIIYDEGKLSARLEKSEKDFMEAWKEGNREKLLEAYKSFQKTLERFRKSHLEEHMPLFVAMHNLQDEPLAAEALFAPSLEKFRQIVEGHFSKAKT
jgi:hypothetical protein